MSLIGESLASCKQAVKIFLDSKTWTPERPGQLSFDAFVKKCSAPDRVKVAGKALSRTKPEHWLVAAMDTVELRGDVELEMLALFEPRDDLDAFTKRNGLRYEDLTD